LENGYQICSIVTSHQFGAWPATDRQSATGDVPQKNLRQFFAYHCVSGGGKELLE
jgi:hypothetical protein